MGDGTGIEWTDATWNPTRGCSRVSEGCRNCYAEKVAKRFSGPGQPYEGLVDNFGRWNGSVNLVPDHLDDPMRWRKPRRIFVDSMSDLFHEAVPDAYIDKVYGVMSLAPQHTFQILTKRPERMRAYLSADDRWAKIEVAARKILLDRSRIRIGGKTLMGPMPHVWHGVSVEDQDAAHARVAVLLETPSAVRFLSVEPLLSSINLQAVCGTPTDDEDIRVDSLNGTWALPRDPDEQPFGSKIDWVIVGCESGAGARPCDVAWIRYLRDQCMVSGVPMFLKQAIESKSVGDESAPIEWGEGSGRKPGGLITLPYLDGEQYAQFPQARST